MKIGKKKGDKHSGVDVNLDAFKEYKSLAELKKEPGKIFAHLSSADQDASYEELAGALKIAKPADQKPAVAAGSPATSIAAPEAAK